MRRNPFGHLSVQERTALVEVDVSEVARSLGSPDYAVQYVGEKGYGKTTHLLALRSGFESAGYVHIAEGQQARIPSGVPLLIDEAQRLTWSQRRRIFPVGIPLVLGTHTDFERALRRAGRRVETIEVQRGTNPERLLRILNRRIEWVRRSPGPLPTIRLETAGRLLDQLGPNIRQIQRALYMVFQDLPEVRDV